MRDFSEELPEILRRIRDARAYLRIDDLRVRLSALESEASLPGLWDHPGKARQVTSELARVKDDIDLVDGLERRASDVETLIEMAFEEDDASMEPEIALEIEQLSTDLDALELRALFTGEHDERDAICEVHSGAG